MNDDLSSSDLQTYHLRRRSGREKRVMEAERSGEPVYKREDREIYWSTESEKNHIDGIGTFDLDSRRRKISDPDRRLKFLLNYRKSIFERKVWGTIDPREILLYIDRKIMSEKIFKEMYGILFQDEK